MSRGALETIRLTYLVPAEREDEVVAELWERGTLGVQVLDGAEAGVVRLEAYFDGEGPAAIPGARLVGSEAVPATDWLAPYREAARPFPVGGRLLLDPRDPDAGALDDEPAPEGRLVLRVPARAAFGTGSHESTRLVLELLEGMDLAGKRVLDVGTGTGVLAFAALLFGARSAVAFDADPAAPCHARENGRLNGLRPALFAGTAAALAAPTPPDSGRFDLALVNVIPEEIGSDLPRIRALLAPGAEAVFSGILAASGARVLGDLRALGLEPVEERTDGEWVAYRVAT